MHGEGVQSSQAVVHVQALMDKETANPEFAFMFNLQTPEHVYFRWRLFSLAQGGLLCRRILRSIDRCAAMCTLVLCLQTAPQISRNQL